MSIQRRVAVITGGTSGIGAATARALASRGYGVVAAGRRVPTTTGADDGIVHVPGDVAQEGLIKRLFAIATERWNRPPEVFVLCAGHGLPGTLLASDDSRWESLIEINYLAVARQLRECATAFLQDGVQPSENSVHDIVVIGSTIGRQVSAHNPVYGSTKFATHALVEGLRQEVCDRGIRVSLIEPGFVTTEFQATAGYDPDWFASIEKQNGPLLAADDVARTIEFVVTQPPHVHLDDIRIRPTRQKV